MFVLRKIHPHLKLVRHISGMSSEETLRLCIKLLPPVLSPSKHKGQAGRIGVIGGCLEYTGAPYFAGITALRCGADLGYVFCTGDAATPIKAYCPELIVLPYLDMEHGKSLTVSRLINVHSLVVGPGLGEHADVQSVVISIVQQIIRKSLKIALIFDADGIGLIADNKDMLADYRGPVYVTPNANEIRKLALAYFGRRDINGEDEAGLCKLARNISPHAVLVLKGESDKIVTADSVYTCTEPGSQRRVGGQGDILSGSLGLFAYWATLSESTGDVPPQVAAGYAACALTRTCARLAYEQKRRATLTSDMIDAIGCAYETLFV